MSSAPVFGLKYMEVDPATSPQKPPTQAEILPSLDPAFVSAWNASKYLFPASWQGDPDFIIACATVAYRYKGGGTTDTPTITTLNPSTGARATGFTLQITGTKFDPDAVINFGGADQVTTGQTTATSISCAIAAGTVLSPGLYTVKVRNASGTSSNTLSFTAT